MYWIDPKYLLTPSDEIKNVIELFIDVSEIPEELDEFDMRENEWDLTNLETLEIIENDDEGLSSKNVVAFLLKFKELKKLVIQHVEIQINYLLDIVRYLGNMKTQRISVDLWVINDELDEEETKDIFNEVLEIVNEKFPFPDRRILYLDFFENNGNRQPSHRINYGERGAMLTIRDVMSESDTSDSESDTSDSENDTSDSMDESDGSSDFINNESAENSDSEDMNVQE